MVRIRRALQKARAEQGLTIIELMVALTIFAVSTVLLTATIASNLRGVLTGKQRAAANDAAQEWMEIAKAFTWKDLGLKCGPGADLSMATDPALAGSAPNYTFSGEPLACTTLATTPFNPHVTAPFKRGNTSVSRAIYITGLDTNADGNVDIKRVTVRASWSGVTLGGVDTTVRITTLISEAGVVPAGPPLTGTADIRNGSITMVSAVGASAISSPSVVSHQLPFVKVDSSRITPTAQVSCAARSETADSGSSSFGPPTLSLVASTNGPRSVGPTAQTYGGGSGAPNTTGALPGSVSCYSTVDGPSPPDGFNYGQGKAAGATVTTYSVNAGSVVPGLGAIDNARIEDKDTVTFDAEGTTDGGPADTLISTATQRQSDEQLLRVTAGSPLAPPIAIDASLGLVRVEALTVTATAMGKDSGVPSAGSTSVTNPTLKIWIYDPGLQLPTSVCPLASRSVTPPGYCVVSRSVNTQLNIVQSFSLVLKPAVAGIPALAMRWSVNISGAPPTMNATQGPTGTTWRAQVNPLVANVSMCVTSDADCSTTAGKVIDLQDQLDMGQVTAVVATGFGS